MAAVLANAPGAPIVGMCCCYMAAPQRQDAYVAWVPYPDPHDPAVTMRQLDACSLAWVHVRHGQAAPGIEPVSPVAILRGLAARRGAAAPPQEEVLTMAMIVWRLGLTGSWAAHLRRLDTGALWHAPAPAAPPELPLPLPLPLPWMRELSAQLEQEPLEVQAAVVRCTHWCLGCIGAMVQRLQARGPGRAGPAQLLDALGDMLARRHLRYWMAEASAASADGGEAREPPATATVRGCLERVARECEAAFRGLPAGGAHAAYEYVCTLVAGYALSTTRQPTATATALQLQVQVQVQAQVQVQEAPVTLAEAQALQAARLINAFRARVTERMSPQAILLLP